MLLKEMGKNLTDVGAYYIVVWGLNHTMFRFLVSLTLLSLVLGWYFDLISYLLGIRLLFSLRLLRWNSFHSVNFSALLLPHDV